MEPEDSLPHSQQPATSVCPHPEQRSSCSHPTSCRPIFKIIPPSRPTSYKWVYFPLRFPHQNRTATRLSPARSTFPAHLILLYFIPRILSGKEYRSLTSSTHSLFTSPVPSSLLGPIFFLITALALQRGVTGTARMLHALTHSSISRQVREQM